MRLIAELKRRLEDEQSYFRQHLIREDVARLEKVVAMAHAPGDVEAYLAAARKVGWTPEDRRTHELRAPLDPLLLAMHQRVTAILDDAARDALEAEIEVLWRAFEQFRLDLLVGCLSRVPRPVG